VITKGMLDVGEDRLEKAAEKEGKSATEIADFYIEDFFGGLSITKFTQTV